MIAASPLQKRLLLLFFFAALAVLFCFPVFRHFDNWGVQDWDVSLFRPGVAQETVTKYRQFPLWNPYFNGGTPHLAYAESETLSLAFLVELLFGVVRAAKINIALHLSIGLAGAYALARHFRLGAVGAITAAVVFMLSSMFAVTLASGMIWGFPIAYIPWAFLCYVKIGDDPRYVVATAVVLTLMWLGGGVYPFTITLLLLALYTVLAGAIERTASKRAVLLLGVVYGLTFCLGAVKFLPAIEMTIQFPRVSNIYSGFSVEALAYGLLGRDQTLAALADRPDGGGFFSGISHNIDEIGMYVGVLPLLLAMVGAVAHGRKKVPLLLCLAICLWLSFGFRCEPFSLWALLHKIPPYNIMRTAERFRIALILILAIFAGLGLETVQAAVERKWRSARAASVVAGAILLAILADLLVVNRPIYDEAFSIPPLELPARGAFKQISGWPGYDESGPETPASNPFHLTYGAGFPAFLANRGTVLAYESMPTPMFAVPISSPEYRGEVYLVGTDGEARYQEWTPNRLVVAIQAAGTGLVVVNQNYYSGWRLAGDQKPIPYKGLLAAEVTPETTRLEFYYRPLSFVIGAVLSVLTLAGIIGWLALPALRRSGRP